MELTKIIARNFVFPTIINTGLEKYWRNKTNNTILNILYHGVVSKNSNYFSPRHIVKEQFEKQLQYLKKEFDIISLPEAFDCYRNKKVLKRKTITVSFDDGYKNNLNIALPLLEKYDIKTTFFICSILTQEMEVRTLWTDIIAYLKYFHSNEIIEIENNRFINFIEEKSKISLPDFVNSKDSASLLEIINYLVKKFEIKTKINQLPSEIWEMMNLEDLKKLSQSKIVDIGSHGHLHYNLGNIKLKDAKEDIGTSKVLLEKSLNKKIDMIAYPFGGYSKEVMDIVSQEGIDKQLAVDYKHSDDADDKRILPRKGISCTTTYGSNIFFINKAFIKNGF